MFIHYCMFMPSRMGIDAEAFCSIAEFIRITELGIGSVYIGSFSFNI